MNDTSESTDVLVVGGGLAGLTAAVHAARDGARTIVLDGAASLGGRARTEQRDDVAFNQGPHALYEGGAGLAILKDLGIDPPGGRPNTAGRGVLDGVEGALPFDARSLATTKLLSPAARVAFARFNTGLGRLDARSLDSVSVSDFLDDAIGHTRRDLRAMVDGLMRLGLYANAPDRFSAGAAIDQLVRSGAGVRYLHHGWGSMVAALEAAAIGAGVAIHSATRVESVDRDDRGWCAVDAGGTRWVARSVVLAGLAPEAVARLTRHEPGRLRTLAGPPARAACLDLVLDAPPAVRFALDLDHHGYYSLHAPVAELAPPGRALVSLARYRRPDEEPDADTDRHTLRAFARRMGIETTLAERYLHDMTVTHGIPLAERGGMTGRPTIDALGTDAPLIAGDWVGPDGLLADASFSSGREAGRAAARKARSVAC